MRYIEHYNRLIERARSRLLEGYSERHHIVPKCVGGTDEESNLVSLTPEEHYVAHQMLVKMYPGDMRILKAATMMAINANGKRPNNRLYGWLKRRYITAIKGTKQNTTQCPNCGKEGGISVMKRWHFGNCGKKVEPWNKGIKMPREFGQRISLRQTGTTRGPMKEETKRKIGEANSGRKSNRVQSAESNQKRSKTLSGRSFSVNSRLKMSRAAKAREQRKRMRIE